MCAGRALNSPTATSHATNQASAPAIRPGSSVGLRHDRVFPIRGTAGPGRISVRLIPDQECIESFWLLGLHSDVGHDSQVRAAPGPVKQLADVIG